MRLWSTSDGLDPTGLVPGEDLVLDLDPAHGDTAPPGVYAFDHLDLEQRERVDRAARELLGAWRLQLGDRLTREGIPWSWVWEFELHNLMGPVIAHALGLQRAMDAYGTLALQLGDRNPRTQAIAEAVTARTDVVVERDASGSRPSGRSQPLARRHRKEALSDRLLRAVTSLGFPSFLRDGAVIFIPYWPLIPVLDRMLADRGWRPAVWLEKRPTRPVRTLRSAVRGGWVGFPTRLDRRQSAQRAAELIHAIDAPATLVLDEIDLSPAVVPLFREMAAGRAQHDLAVARLWDRALRKRRATRLICANDIEPIPRILVVLARRHGLPTLAIQHGAFLIPQPVSDLDAVDEVVLWSRAVAPPMPNLNGPVHVFGYPLPHSPAGYRCYAGRPDGPTALILGQVGDRSTATVDSRLTVRSYHTATAAFLNVFPDGGVILRPHPSEGSGPAAVVAERFKDRVLIDRSVDLTRLMGRADLCVGGTSAATLQAAVEGVPTVVLNLSGFAWPWPLGGDSEAPVAHSEAELTSVVECFKQSGSLPGQADLLGGLGADGGDAAARVLELLEDSHRPRQRREVRTASKRS